jgi:hypothetical protein
MKVLTAKILDSYKPCYPASRYYDDAWQGTVLDIAKDTRIRFSDRLWAVLRDEHVSKNLINLFSQWCQKQVSLVSEGLPEKLWCLDVSRTGDAIEDSFFAANCAGYVEEQKFSDNSISRLAYDTGFNRARKEQEKQLIAMLEEGIKTGDVK